MLIFLSRSQAACRVLIVLHDSPHSPSTSPRSIASIIGDALDSVFNLDTRIFRTLGPLFASAAEFELTGQRSALPSPLEEPLRWKYQLVGNYHLNGIAPGRTA